MSFYILVMAVYLGTDLIATWGLNLQFGVTGVLNFAFIADLAVGGYAYAVLTLGPQSSNGGFQSYVLGLGLPPWAGIVLATAAGAVFGALIGTIGLKRLRPDYQAIAMLVVAIVALTIVEADTSFLDGNQGLTLLPNPVGGSGPTGGGWWYVVLCFAVCAAGYLVLRRFTDGPLGRSLRAVRDDDRAALAIGKNVVALRILVQFVGGGFAGLSGALLVGFIGAWSPSAWQYVETMSLLTAVIVGGMASNPGVAVGTLLVPVVLQQGAQYVPNIASRPGLAEDLGWMLTSALVVFFIWNRPRGLVPERRPRYGAAAKPRRRWSLYPLGLPAGIAPPVAALGPAAGAPPGAAVPAVPATPAAALAGLPADPLGRGPALAASAVPALDARPAAGAAGLSRLAPRRSAEPAAAVEGRPLLEVGELVVRFGGVHAVDGASLAAGRGAITGLIGPNGAGKSTLINAVSGFVRPHSGRIVFDGRELTGASPHRIARAGLVRTFQLARHFKGLTTFENLLVAPLGQRAETLAGILGGPRYWRPDEEQHIERARGLMAMFEMTDKADEPAGDLSGGQRRMLELMRAVMTNPSMLLLDEPLAGLSPRWSRLLEDAVAELRRQGLSFVLVEHELGIVERLCDSVIVMAQGKVLARGSMSELRSQQEVQAAYVIG